MRRMPAVLASTLSSLGATWERAKWTPLHGDDKSSAGGTPHGKTILTSDGKRKLVVKFYWYQLFETVVITEGPTSESQALNVEVAALEKLKARTRAQKNGLEQ